MDDNKKMSDVLKDSLIDAWNIYGDFYKEFQELIDKYNEKSKSVHSILACNSIKNTNIIREGKIRFATFMDVLSAMNDPIKYYDALQSSNMITVLEEMNESAKIPESELDDIMKRLKR